MYNNKYELHGVALLTNETVKIMSTYILDKFYEQKCIAEVLEVNQVTKRHKLDDYYFDAQLITDCGLVLQNGHSYVRGDYSSPSNSFDVYSAENEIDVELWGATECEIDSDSFISELREEVETALSDEEIRERFYEIRDIVNNANQELQELIAESKVIEE